MDDYTTGDVIRVESANAYDTFTLDFTSTNLWRTDENWHENETW